MIRGFRGVNLILTVQLLKSISPHSPLPLQVRVIYVPALKIEWKSEQLTRACWPAVCCSQIIPKLYSVWQTVREQCNLHMFACNKHYTMCTHCRLKYYSRKKHTTHLTQKSTIIMKAQSMEALCYTVSNPQWVLYNSENNFRKIKR